MQTRPIALAACIGGMLIPACSSGSSSDSSALSVPSQMSIVDADGDNANAAFMAPPGTAALTGSDYTTDEARIWIHDESMEALDMVNVILCSIGQTNFGAASVLNKGAYTALVGCDQGGSDPSASSGQVSYQDFTVVSTRSAGSTHGVKFWFDQKDRGDNSDTRLYGRLTIFESPSTARPFGRFLLTWKQMLTSEAHDSTNLRSKGSLKTVDRSDGKVEFVMHDVSGDVDGTVNTGEQHYRMRARVVSNATFTEGQGYLESKQAYNNGGGKVIQGSDYYVQFNQRYLARKKVGTSTVIKVFDRQDFTTFGFRYGLYQESTEQRVTNDSGFSIENASGARGYVGYHGMWFPDGVTITHGQTLTRRSYDDSSTTEYTAFVAPGQMHKQTRSNSTMGNVKDEEFVTWDTVGSTDMRVVWTGSAFNKVATFDKGQGKWTDVTPVSVASQYTTGDYVQMFNNSRGSVQFTWPSGGPLDATVISIWTHAVVNGASAEMASGDLTLYGYFDMLRSNITSNQANFVSSETPFFTDATNISEKKTYLFNKSTLTLQLSSIDVALGTGVTLGGPRSGGLNSGPMVATALGSLGDLQSATTTYNWSIGSDNHSKYRTVKNAQGAFVTFAAPLRFNYTHTESGNAFNGKSFTLELEGDELRGIPFTEDATSRRWYPGFNITDGTVLTDQNGARYLVKMLEGEQTINAVGDPSAVITAQGFDLDTTLTPPSSSYVDPAVGARPAVTDPPKFIDGEAQGVSNQ